ncbi:hypothetical protein ACXYN8_07365 [Altererythrobacter sp. CAU 1778]
MLTAVGVAEILLGISIGVMVLALNEAVQNPDPMGRVMVSAIPSLLFAVPLLSIWLLHSDTKFPNWMARFGIIAPAILILAYALALYV